jgi:catechol 2,3-dioxygenase-like lactoylglutathione lyase family enzyme
MFDHMSIGVRDLDAARRFYDAFFAPLGHANAWNQPTEMAYGPRGESRQFFIYPVEGEQVAGLGAHIAFAGDSRSAIDAAFQAAVEKGATVVRKAGEHPDIAPDYYGAVLLDPDGNKLEVVLDTMH